MSIQLTVEQEEELDMLARKEQRTSDDLAQEAVANLLAGREEHREAVERARQDVADGRLIQHEEVWTRLTRRFGW